MVADGEDGIRFDLSDVFLPNRPKKWMDTLNGFFYEFDFRLPSGFSYGEIKGCHAGDLSIASIKSDAMSVFRTASHVTHDGLDAYFVLLPTRERIALTQRGNEAIVQDRQFSLVSTSDAYTYIQNDTTRFNNLIIPGNVVRQFAPHADNTVASVLGNAALEGIFYDVAQSLCIDFENIDVRARDVLSKQIVELLGLVLDGADVTSHATPIRMAHYRRILQLIDRNFSDPRFDIQTISETLQISIRYLQAIANSNDTTISRMIRARRIVEARHLLTYYGDSYRSVTDIAYRVGFSDPTHFSRVFKQETGHSPSSFMRQAHRP